MKKRILQIIPSFGIGGAEKVVLDYLRHSEKDLVDLRAISLFPSNNTNYDQIIKDENLPVTYLNKKPGLDLAIIKQINQVIKSFQPDVVHVHLAILKYLIPAIIKYRKKIKFFYTIHNEPQKDAPGKEGTINRFAIKTLGVRPIALTTEMAKEANAYYKVDNTLVLGNGIDVSEYKEKLGNLESLKNELNLIDKKVIGHVGRFNTQKNHTFLIDIFSEVSKKDPSAVLVLVGDGDLRSDIEHKVNQLNLSNKVRFLGIRKDVKELLQVMDVFVFPSLHEGFPITLLEAQATGVKCVISDAIDPDVVLNPQTLVFSLSSSAQDWADAILNENLSSHPKQTIEDFDIKIIMKKLLENYGGVQNEESFISHSSK